MKIFEQTPSPEGQKIETKKIPAGTAPTIDMAVPRAPEKETDPAKERLENFLWEKNVFTQKDGILIVDTGRLHSPEILAELKKMYLGTFDGKNSMGSLKIIYEKFSELEAVASDEYEKHLSEKSAPRTRKIFEQQNKSVEELAREKLLDILEQNGCLERKDGLFIIDLQKISKGEVLSRISHAHLASKNNVPLKSDRHTIFDLLQNLQVVSRADYEKSADKNHLATKKLFNVPENVDAAFDLEKIKNADDYYLDFWDLYKHIPQWDYKMKTRDGNTLDMREFYLATRIFRDFKAKRDEQGKLLVIDKDGRYRKISNGWIKKNLGRMGSLDGIHSFLLKSGQHLQEKGLLMNKDFAIQTTGVTSETRRKEFTYQGNLMQIMINNATYYIGRNNFVYEGKKIPLKNIKIVILDNQTAGIVETLDGKESIRYTFSLLNDEEISQKRKAVQASYDRPLSPTDLSNRSRVTKKEIKQRISPWRITNDNPKRKDETAEDYAERIATLADYKFINKLTDDFVQNSEVAIHKELTWREQQWLASAAYNLGVRGNYAKLLDFGKKYKSNGLKTFLSLEFSQEMGAKILGIGERFDQATADAIFAKYAEIADAVSSIEDEIQTILSGKEVSRQEIAEGLLREGKDLLAYFSNLAPKKITLEEIMSKLERVNANVMLTGSIIRQLSREEIAGLDLRNIPHIQKFEEIRASDLLNHPELLEQMKKIIRAQFPEGDDASFENECRTNPDLRITATLANNEILSFFSKERKSKNIEYIDWFIANPDAPIKGLGEATMRLGFDSKNNSEQAYYAVAKPHVKSFQIMVENLGFVAFEGSTEDGEYKHHYARIRKFPKDASFASRNLSEENRGVFRKAMFSICSDKNSTQDMVFAGRPMRVCKIEYHGQTHHDDIRKTDSDGWIMKEIDRQNANGFVLTRFIPESAEKNNQAFYAVFEKDPSSEELREELEEVISPKDNNSHSDSKKTLSI